MFHLRAGEEPPQSSKKASITSGIPLAEQVRPDSLDEYVGQDHVLGGDKILRMLLDKHDIPSMILWGPPGCGKVCFLSRKNECHAASSSMVNKLLLF